MIGNEKAIEKMVFTQLLRLNATILGVILGLIFGCGIFIATNYLILKGGLSIGPHLALLGQFFIGYRITFLGSLIGLAYGFVTGFAAGYTIAWLYNWFASFRDGKEA